MFPTVLGLSHCDFLGTILQHFGCILYSGCIIRVVHGGCATRPAVCAFRQNNVQRSRFTVAFNLEDFQRFGVVFMQTNVNPIYLLLLVTAVTSNLL